MYKRQGEDVLAVCLRIEQAVGEVRGLIEKNRIFVDRTKDVGIVSGEDAISFGWTGPCLRASGIDRDLRKDEPYYGYETYDFDTVIGTSGDTYDRIMCRMIEMGESLRIVRQAVARLKAGPVNAADARVSLPSRERVYHDMEALINSFKLVYEGVRPPAGECYDALEAANGELGFLITSDGGTNPYRIKVRPPCFTQFAAFSDMIEGELLADAVAALGSINIIAGELDR